MKVGGALALLVAACWVAPRPALSQARSKHPIGIDDFLALKLASDPRLSPDGKLVAFVVSVPSLVDNRNNRGSPLRLGYASGGVFQERYDAATPAQ